MDTLPFKPSRRLTVTSLHRRYFGVLAGMLVAIMPVIAALTIAPSAGATAEYANGSIADTALRYVGRWGGNACTDSRKPGDYGGQCRSFVNCIVWMTSGGTQNLGGSDYFRPFLKAGGREILTLGELQRGDIIQEGQGKHTYIIVKRAGGNSFTVVDSNKKWNERVSTYDREVSLSSDKRAFRMGVSGLGLDMVSTAAQAQANAVEPMMGALDSLEVTKEGVTARGWAIDRDVTRPIDVRFYEVTDPKNPTAGRSTAAKANTVRMDVGSSYPGFGSTHGFRATIPLKPGSHAICAYAVNVPNTPGADLKLGCQSVSVK